MLVNIETYAKLHKVGYRWVYQLVRTGRLKASRLGSNWIIDDTTPFPELRSKLMGYRVIPEPDINDVVKEPVKRLKTQLKEFDFLDGLG